tara:strand:- start:5368 stop:5955 length:588 start_codon:yes stop_codon:yes gene_type:complete
MIEIYNILVSKILDEIIPSTKKAIDKGNKIFGAAILNKKDFSTIIIGTNNEIINPMFHGEISTIYNFYQKKLDNLYKPNDCIFLSTHEPCSLCLSAITWCGFDNFYYFFPYSDTKDKFNIPHDINIMKEVFNLDNGQYNKKNSYWRSYSIINEINKFKTHHKMNLEVKINKIYEEYEILSEKYQKMKNSNKIPLN